MSKPYTYEIDEQRLRLQLRSLEAPLKEELWSKFENYVSALPRELPQSRLLKFELNLNRNVVLPAVFGIIICIFSFVLFNFISIKKPQEKNIQKATFTPTNTQVLPAEEVLELKQSVAETVPETKQQLASETAPISEKNVSPSLVDLPAKVSAVNSNVAKEGSSTTLTNPASTPEVNKPAVGNKKGRASAIEEQLSEIRPSLVSDEEVVEVIPN